MYSILGSMFWASPFYHPTCKVLGAIMPMFSSVVGLAAFVFGIILSHKLDKVRKQVQLQHGDIMQGCPPGGFSKVQFKLLVRAIAAPLRSTIVTWTT